MPTLILALEGPMQAWGSGSKFEIRDTERIPTKSGIIGMIAAAMGRKREDPLDDLNELNMTVRVDQAGKKFKDLQIMQVRGVKDPYKGTKYYLADAKFLVCLSHSDREFLEKISDALNHPVYPIFLGRRNCLPTGNLNRGIVEMDGVAAAYQFPWLVKTDENPSRTSRSQTKSKPRSLRMFVEGESGFRQYRIKDHPISFSRKNRKYQGRVFSEVTPVEIQGNPDTPKNEIDYFEEVLNVSNKD